MLLHVHRRLVQVAEDDDGRPGELVDERVRGARDRARRSGHLDGVVRALVQLLDREVDVEPGVQVEQERVARAGAGRDGVDRLEPTALVEERVRRQQSACGRDVEADEVDVVGEPDVLVRVARVRVVVAGDAEHAERPDDVVVRPADVARVVRVERVDQPLPRLVDDLREHERERRLAVPVVLEHGVGLRGAAVRDADHDQVVNLREGEVARSRARDVAVRAALDVRASDDAARAVRDDVDVGRPRPVRREPRVRSLLQPEPEVVDAVLERAVGDRRAGEARKRAVEDVVRGVGVEQRRVDRARVHPPVVVPDEQVDVERVPNRA